jgi:WhiB family redox-sensing transcriptional regulator
VDVPGTVRAVVDLSRFQALAPGDEPSGLVDLLYRAGRPGWYADALCREYPKLSWHPELGQSTAAAKAVCERCLVRSECLSYALADPTLVGVWGATGPRERARLRRARARADAA